MAVNKTPGPLPTWRRGRTWQVRAYAQGAPAFVGLEVERAPASGRLPELADLLELLSIGVGQAEHHARLRAHLTRRPVGWLKRWAERSRQRLHALGGLAITSLTVATLGGGFWLGARTGATGSPAPALPTLGADRRATGDSEAPFLIDSPFQDTPVIAYPLPDKPFSNQARAPCLTERGEEEINGGCWFELARRPPCHKDLAEYRGKCYAPVSKDRGPRAPQALHP